MGTKKTRVEDHAPLVRRIERRISVTSAWLTMAGRGTYIDFVVASMAIYHM